MRASLIAMMGFPAARALAAAAKKASGRLIFSTTRAMISVAGSPAR